MKKAKLYTVYRVEWEDAHGGDMSWSAPKKSDMRPHKIVSVGQCAGSNKRGMLLVLSRNKNHHHDACIFIPAKGITKIKRLR